MSNVEVMEEMDLEEIYPKLTNEKLKTILKYYENDAANLEAVNNIKKLNDLSDSIKFLLTRIFISKNDKSLAGLKARFINSMELIKEFDGSTIEAENIELEKQKIDFILRLQSESDRIYWIIFLDYFDEISIKRIDRSINKHFENVKSAKNDEGSIEQMVPDLIIFVSLKIERKTAIKYESIKIAGSAVSIVHYIEYLDANKPFENQDLIYINQFKVKGFNFGSLDDILLCADKIVKKGKCEIKVEKSNKKIHTLWKGIVNPSAFFKKGGN